MLEISIIIPILNEEKYIASCLDSILQSDYDKDKMEVLLVDGGSEDGTMQIINEYQKRYHFIKLLHNPKKIVPVAMNIGIKEASGEYVVRLDAHSSYPKDYFSKLIYWHKKLEADNVGGVITTEVKNKTQKSSAIRKVLSSRFGVGNSEFRVGVDSVKEVSTVPFGCYKKDVFKKYGYYDERLVRNQDIELNKRIIQGGGKIYLVPDIICTYYARESFEDLAKNNFSNGKWGILTPYYTKNLNSLSLRHFIPLLFVLSLIIPLFLMLLDRYFVYMSFISFGSYLALAIIASFKLKENTKEFFYLVSTFFVLHLSYGFGSTMGILKVLDHNKYHI